MHKTVPAIFLFLITSVAMSAMALDPLSFEQIWLQNNQRNLFKRYHYYNQQVQTTGESVYLIGVDAAPDRTIATSDGDQNALLSRMHFHFQNEQYLFLVDWFSAIPQPQTTEGFIYGDLVAGYTWHNTERDGYLTLGLRQKSTPRSILVNSETVFNAVSDATEEEYSLFVHVNYQGYDFGSFYSENNELEAASFNLPLAKLDQHAFTSTIAYYREDSEVDLQRRYELALNHDYQTSTCDLRSGVILAYLPDMDETDISNMFADYISPVYAGMRFNGGLYYYRDIERDDTLTGAKLGLLWQLAEPEAFQIGFSIQKNAMGDFHALIVPDEPIFSFTLTAGIE